jgi:hypothetical protein
MMGSPSITTTRVSTVSTKRALPTPSTTLRVDAFQNCVARKRRATSLARMKRTPGSSGSVCTPTVSGERPSS